MRLNGVALAKAAEGRYLLTVFFAAEGSTKSRRFEIMETWGAAPCFVTRWKISGDSASAQLKIEDSACDRIDVENYQMTKVSEAEYGLSIQYDYALESGRVGVCSFEVPLLKSN